jgi:hypothetical protein
MKHLTPVVLAALVGAVVSAVITSSINRNEKEALQEEIIALQEQKLTMLKTDGLAQVLPELEQRLREPTGVMKLMLTGLLYERDPGVWKRRITGKDWPESALTMVGLRRLDNLEDCIEAVVADDVPGDLIEAGAWRGGATIFMRFMLDQLNDDTRSVWVADSFEGLPPPNPVRFPADADYDLSQEGDLAVSIEEVQRNFARFGLLDSKARFLKGWFKDSLPNAPIEQLSVLRVDADLYESTLQALAFLYPKLSVGGFCIIDDWGAMPPCQKATDDYRRICGIDEAIVPIDGVGVYWRKERDVSMTADDALRGLTAN